jgi:glycosyltransferase involved in cell wall biosynthesis
MLDFTIITPSYNYGHFIAGCLQSVASQQGVTFEHLVIDGSSSDNTAEVVAEYPHASFLQEPDQGMSDAINKGFRRAKGKWVMWLNADDMLRPRALMEVKAFSEASPAADVIYGCWNFIDADGSFIRRMTLFPFQRGMLANLGCYIASTSTFFRKTTTIDQGFYLNILFRTVMDGEYYCRLANAGKKFYYLPKVIADFRLHDASISQKNLRRMDLNGILAHQIQLAEARAVRRVYGVKLFHDEMLNGIVDGFLFHIYRFLKGFLRLVYRSRTR